MKNPQSSREGYLFVDHRASPGLPADVARFWGRPPELSGEGKLYEQATLTCSHCGGVVVKNPYRIRARENCPKCGNHYICDGCYALTQHPDYAHMPIARRIDIAYGDGKQIALGSPLHLLLTSKE